MERVRRFSVRPRRLVVAFNACVLASGILAGSATAIPTSAPPPNIPGAAVTGFLYGVVDEATGLTNEEPRSVSTCKVGVYVDKYIEDPMGGGHYPIRAHALCEPYPAARIKIDFIMVYDDEEYSDETLIYATQPAPPMSCLNCSELSWIITVPCGHSPAEVECGHELYAVSRAYPMPAEVKIESGFTPTVRLRPYDFRVDGRGSSCDVATPHPNLEEICYLFGEGGN